MVTEGRMPGAFLREMVNVKKSSEVCEVRALP